MCALWRFISFFLYNSLTKAEARKKTKMLAQPFLEREKELERLHANILSYYFSLFSFLYMYVKSLFALVRSYSTLPFGIPDVGSSMGQNSEGDINYAILPLKLLFPHHNHLGLWRQKRRNPWKFVGITLNHINYKVTFIIDWACF